MTPEQALVLIENLKREAPEKLVQAGNTIALHAAYWAQQALQWDKKIYAEVQELKALLAKAAGIASAAPAEAEAPAVNGVPAVDPTTLKGEALERYMDAVTAGMPENQNAPAPTPIPTAEAEVEAAPEKPPGVVVVPAAAAKAKAKAQADAANGQPKA
jgi:hypothetical protein